MSVYDNLNVAETVLDIEVLRGKVEFLGNEIYKFQKPDDRVEYLHALYAMMEKYQNLYVRGTLEDTDDTIQLRNDVISDLRQLGMLVGRDPYHYFKESKREILQELRDLGQDVDSPLDLG